MRRVLVTGANKGIGFAIGERVLEHADDTFLLLGSRDAERGKAAIAQLVAANPQFEERVALVEIDVGDDGSVQSAADQIRESCGDDGLYGIVNNAGIGFGSADMEAVLNVNVYGIYRVCTALIPLLGEGGRIVNITSASGPNFVADCSDEMQLFFTRTDISWGEIDALMQQCNALATGGGDFPGRGLGSGDSYGLSKACANAYTVCLARERPALTINACTPGFIATDLTQSFRDGSGRSAEELGMKSPREGAASTLFLLFGEPEGSGHYYGSDSKRSPLDRYRAPGSPAYRGEA